MKNKLKLLFTFFILTIIVLSCSDVLSEKISTESKLVALQTKINEKSLNSITITNKIQNIDCFEKIQKIKSIKDKKTLDRNVYNSSIKDYKIEFNEETIVILKDYFKTLSKNDETNFKAITQLYINEMQNLSDDANVVVECTEKLVLMRDFMIYFNTEKGDNSSIYQQKWACGHRDCFDCCMYRKAKEVWSDGNWVDQAGFIASVGTQVAWWAGSCAWDC